MAKIFISYRREDTEYPAQSIYEKVADRFGSECVIFDVDTIPLGRDFRDYIDQEVGKCDILLAVIGNKWLDILKQRLNEPKDYVRIEIQAALERDIPVVPVLVENTSIPNETDLPPELSQLAYKQAAEVRAGTDYQSHLKRLINGLENLMPVRPVAKDSTEVEEERFDSVSKIFTNSLGMKFVLIPAGRFKMGSGISPVEAKSKYGGIKLTYNFEHPNHEVKINHPFYLQSTPVTQGQWKKVMNNHPSKFKDCGDECPVEKVSWNDTQKFIIKLNKMESTLRYRLPSEAEWEYACRAGTTTEFSFGDDAKQLNNYAWFTKNSDKKTHPVSVKKPNPWDLYDMYGNVWEWVEDHWHKNYDGAPVHESAWIIKNPSLFSKIARDTVRVVRGGSWYNNAGFCRSASRVSRSILDYFDGNIGFRLAKSITLAP